MLDHGNYYGYKVTGFLNKKLVRQLYIRMLP